MNEVGASEYTKKSGVMALFKAVQEHSEHLLGVLYKKPGFVSCMLKDFLDGDSVYFVAVSDFVGTLGNVCYMHKVYNFGKKNEKMGEQIPVPTYQIVEALTEPLDNDNAEHSLSKIHYFWYQKCIEETEK